jgi:maleate isomerase
MNIRPTEYASAGLVGVGTPQANPTVEAEMLALRPAGVGLVTARLVCLNEDPKRRLLSYIDDLEQTMARYDSLKLDAFGFACTGSTYLYGYDEERALVARLEDQFGYRVITAAAAIETRLKQLGAESIALIAPYPGWLFQPGIEYWTGRGFNVRATGHARLPSSDLHEIYQLGSHQALEVLAGLDLDGVDAVLFSGTGMPSLRAIIQGQQDTGLPAMSSNLCMAASLFDAIGLDGMSATAPAAWADRVETL